MRRPEDTLDIVLYNHLEQKVGAGTLPLFAELAQVSLQEAGKVLFAPIVAQYNLILSV